MKNKKKDSNQITFAGFVKNVMIMTMKKSEIIVT